MPNTIADNLQALNTARLNIADAITNKGGTVNTDKRFSLFPNDINSIPTANLTTLNVTENGTYYESTPTEITSTSFPITLNNCLETPLLDYLISGNMEQSGAPTSTNPIQPQGTGERTGNLFDEVYPDISDTLRYRALNLGNGTYTLSSTTEISPGSAGTLFFLAGNVSSGASTATNAVYKDRPITVTSTDGYVTIAYRTYTIDTPVGKKTMLNSGSTALSYEPYGYKIPISSGGENLFDYPQNNYSTTINSVVWIIENGVIKGEGFTTSQGLQDNIIVRKNGLYRAGNYPNYYILDASNDLKLPAGTYTFSYIPITEPTSTSVRPRLIVGHEGGRYAEGTAKFVWNGDTFTVDSEDYIALAINTTNDIGEYEYGKFMLNHGATALPYEPYIEPTETNIYLGEVQTTRKIKKLVLTGNEDGWREGTGFFYNQQISPDYKRSANNITLMCTHYQAYGQVAQGGNVPNGYCSFYYDPAFQRLYFVDNSITSLADFKTYLQQQYANGTPVTIWYVLANETTGIVNEPLRKIGDYADTLSYEQAGVQIPTNRGNTVIDVMTELKPSEMYIKYDQPSEYAGYNIVNVNVPIPAYINTTIEAVNDSLLESLEGN